MSSDSSSGHLDPPAATRASARLGLTLRSVLLQPSVGFRSAVRSADRRQRTGQRPSEGASPYVLGALGGAAAMILWLKIGAIAGYRDLPRESYAWSVFAAALVLGALLALLAQVVWGSVGPFAVRAGGGAAQGRDLRIVWGLSAFPQMGALVVLLPLDILIVGSDSFTSEPLTDPLSTVWAAVSIAVGLALATWSAWLFVRGLGVVATLPPLRAAAVCAAAVGLAVGSSVLLLAAAGALVGGGAA